MQGLNFSEAQPTDIPAITDVLTDATQYKVAQGDTSWGDEGWFSHEIQDRMSEGSTFYLVKHGNEIVGTVSLSWQDQRNWGDKPGDAGYIHQLATKDGYHGMGIGGQTIDWLATQVKKTGKQFLRLDCDANNAGLCGYYEKHGFIRAGTNTRQDDEMGTYEAALYERPV